MWIREELSDEQLADRLREWALNRDTLMAFLPFARQRMGPIGPGTTGQLSGLRHVANHCGRPKSCGMKDERLLTVLQFALAMESVQSWSGQYLNALKAVADAMEIKRETLAPLFIAIAGSSASISVMDSMNLLGADMSKSFVTPLTCSAALEKRNLKSWKKSISSWHKRT